MRPKGTAAELEARRRQAVALLGQGKGVNEVARRIGCSTGSVDRWKMANRQAAGSHQDHDSHALTRLRDPDPVAAPLGLGERAVNETLVRAIRLAILHEPAGIAHETLEEAFTHPALEVTMHRALGS